MHLKTDNVNTAFFELVSLFTEGERRGHPVVRRPSRNGDVLMIDEPVTITYRRPTERVLINPARDANCFFHLYEALYMLAGRNEIAPLAYYAANMANYSDDGKVQNGAYGYRWRHALAPRWVGDNVGCPPESHEARPIIDEPRSTIVDQLDILVGHLKANPDSRRAVLSMWNVEDDLLNIGGYGNRTRCRTCNGTGTVPIKPMDDHPEGYELVNCPDCKGKGWVDEPGSKDVCCNLDVMLSIREEMDPAYFPRAPEVDEFLGESAYKTLPTRKLDITVTNRSNDLTWGLLGANHVQFSILQEYMAARLGVEVGVYHHFTNNLHAYTDPDRWKPNEWLKEYEKEEHENLSYYRRPRAPVPLVDDVESFDREVAKFVCLNDGRGTYQAHADSVKVWNNDFLSDVARPMCHAFHQYKQKAPGWPVRVAAWLEQVRADDWRLAGRQWMEKRVRRHRERTHADE